MQYQSCKFQRNQNQVKMWPKKIKIKINFLGEYMTFFSPPKKIKKYDQQNIPLSFLFLAFVWKLVGSIGVTKEFIIHTWYDQSEPKPKPKPTTRVTFFQFCDVAKVAIISKSDLAEFGHMY